MSAERGPKNPVAKKLFDAASPADKARLSEVAAISKRLISLAAPLLPPMEPVSHSPRAEYRSSATFLHEGDTVTGIEVNRWVRQTPGGFLDTLTFSTQQFDAASGRVLSGRDSFLTPTSSREATRFNLYDGTNRKNPKDLAKVEAMLKDAAPSSLSLRDMGNLGRIGRTDQWQQLRQTSAVAKEAAKILPGDLDAHEMEASQDRAIPDAEHERRSPRLLEVVEP